MSDKTHGKAPAAPIVLHQFKPLHGMPNPSPFCIKLETYLRMAGFAYTVKTIGAPKSSTGKAPYIEVDGQTICDSGLIIAHLEAHYGHRVEGRLTMAERGTSLALQRMMEEHLYWVAVYARWLDPHNRDHSNAYIKELVGAPGWLMPLILPVIRRSIRKSLHAHGIGRHDPATLWQLGIGDVHALGQWLGNRTWGFGENPTVIDAVLFAFTACIVHTPWDFPLKTETMKNRNLLAHKERMLARYFPELAQAA